MTTNQLNTKYSVFVRLYKELQKQLNSSESVALKKIIKKSLAGGIYKKDPNVGSIVNITVNTLLIMIEELGMRSVPIIALILYYPYEYGAISEKEIEAEFGKETVEIIKGLTKVNGLTPSTSAIASDNYVKLLLTMAEDLRVILIRVAGALYSMRNIRCYDENYRLWLSMNVKHLYAPLAHKLGLYAIKTELEDLYFEYTDKEAYDYVVQKLEDTAQERDKFIADFIAPIKKKLDTTGLRYDMKGRVKSVSSINNKLRKQQIEFENIYDVFAIRIILDSELEKEKAECWQVYSIVTDMYTPNPKRLKDWLSIPKSNGYESLHITVMGPASRWVEVQIRTKRMDEVAERGFAAHWRYKGVKSESKIDDWLTSLREVMENSSLDVNEKLEDFKLDVYDDEIYVFTPKGDLLKLPQGSTVLDFAFSIHSKVGETCVSGKVNGKNVPIKYELKNGDQIEVVTSPNQKPKQDWLSFVRSSKARNKIRQSLKEEANKQVEIAKELLQRRFKNRKIDVKEGVLMRLVKKLGFKHITDFYIKIAEDDLDPNYVIDQYLQQEKKEADLHEAHHVVSADKYVIHTDTEKEKISREELILDKDLTGVEYTLAKCCNPIYGDEIFGFVSTHGIKIHRLSCPNADDMFSRFNYRVIPARWSGASQSVYVVPLRIIGNDDITIVNNITSLISKEDGIGLRSISIDSDDGVFHGNISVTINNRERLNALIKKLKGIKGVKEVSRLN